MAISIPANCKRFRAAVAPMFACVLVMALFGFFGAVLVLRRVPFDRRALAVATASLPASSLLLTWLLSILCPASFSAAGIYGHSFWGNRRFVRWDDISEVRKFRFFNLPWLRIRARSDGKVTWLALFQSRPVEFQTEIQRLAPAGSLVLKYLG